MDGDAHVATEGLGGAKALYEVGCCVGGCLELGSVEVITQLGVEDPVAIASSELFGPLKEAAKFGEGRGDFGEEGCLNGAVDVGEKGAEITLCLQAEACRGGFPDSQHDFVGGDVGTDVALEVAEPCLDVVVHDTGLKTHAAGVLLHDREGEEAGTL